MAGTIHQAMAYLGLTAEQAEPQEPRQERSRRSQDNDFATFEDDIYDYQDDQLDTHELESRDDLFMVAHQAEVAEEGVAPVDNPVSQASAAAAISRAERQAEPSAESHEQPAPRYGAAQTQTTETPKARTAAVRSIDNESEDQLRQITTIHPRSYNDAKIIGESFRENIPVIMNVTDMGEAEAKRLVDFSAGLAFALHGSIERVTDKVFLLTPTNLEVLAPEGAEMPVALDSDASSLFNQG